MKPNVNDITSVIQGFESGHDALERIRLKTIRESDIIREYAVFDGAFQSAKYLGVIKPTTGLIELAEILNKKKK